jgi:hypothetical protein
MNDGDVGSVRIALNYGAICPRHLLLYMRVALKRAEEKI